jgi:hypothetical protein
VELTFDENRRSKSGRLIPIEKSTGLPHEYDGRPKTNERTSSPDSQEAIQVEVEVLQLLQLLTSKIKILIEARQAKQ